MQTELQRAVVEQEEKLMPWEDNQMIWNGAAISSRRGSGIADLHHGRPVGHQRVVGGLQGGAKFGG